MGKDFGMKDKTGYMVFEITLGEFANSLLSRLVELKPAELEISFYLPAFGVIPQIWNRKESYTSKARR